MGMRSSDPDDDSTLRRIEIQYGVRVRISRISRGISLRGYFIASIFAANRSDAARGGGRMKFRHGSGVMNTLGELRAMRDPGSRVATPKNHALSLSLSRRHNDDIPIIPQRRVGIY